MNKMQCSIKMQTIVRIDHHHGTENHNLWNLIDILRANIVISDNYHKEEVIKRTSNITFLLIPLLSPSFSSSARSSGSSSIRVSMCLCAV